MLHDGVFIERQPRHGGQMVQNQGLTALVETERDHTVVLTSLRLAPFSLEQILSLGIKPDAKRVLIAKGTIAPRAAYEPVSAGVIEVDSPGITAADPSHFTYRHRRRPMFPFDPEASYPDEADGTFRAAER
jgi:microcystin degradation protein MlrC